MKILYITNQIDAAAGLERVLSIKASALADDFNYEVHIITLNQGNKTLFYDFSAKIKYHDINVKGNSMLYLFNYITHIKRVVKKINPDCISVCDDGLKGFYIPLILGCKYPIIYERHASKYISKNSDEINILQRLKLKILNYLMLFGAKYFDRFVVLTSNNLKEWKNSIGYIPQETQLLNTSIKNNIAFGINDAEINENKLKNSIKLAGLSEFIKDLTHGYETIVGERGSWLSGGQRQRISIARAIYYGKTFLVLDEATNSLDRKTSLEILQNIKQLKENGFPILIVSHDMEIMNFVDKKLELKNT